MSMRSKYKRFDYTFVTDCIRPKAGDKIIDALRHKHNISFGLWRACGRADEVRAAAYIAIMTRIET